MDDDLGLLSSASSVTSVTCSSSTNNTSSIFHNNITKGHQSCGGTKQRLHSGSFVRRSSSPSLISSSSRNDDNRTNRTSMNNDSVSSSNSSVFIEEKHTPSHHHEPGKLLKSLQSNHRSFFSEDYDTELSSICNMAKVKISKQHEIGFLNLLHECQAWIETTSNSKFPYPNDFRKSLENGVILCELLNVLKKDSVRRINRHSTPIAGIDNLNVFLKACQEHFHLIQSDLFDITDLEDLNRRRGDELASPFSCYSPDDSKESSDLSATSSEKLNNCNPNLNDYLADEEQKRRLKKVINTINWLSRKAIELGIQIPYHFDITNPANHSAKSVRNSIHPNHNTKAALGCSYNSVSSSTSSTSSSSSYCSSFSNSSLSQYSTSSSLSSSSSLSVIVPTSNLANSLLPPQIPHCSSKVSTPNNKSAYSSPASNFQKRHSIQQSNPFKNLDEIELAQRQASNIDDINNCHKPLLNHQRNNSNQNYTMSYIYKQQQNGKGSSLADKARSPSLVIDPSSSSASSTSSEYKNNKDNVEFIDQVSSSNHPSLINNDKDKIGDQDEIQLIDSTMSPISSTNSAVVSPRVNNNNNSTSNSLNTSTTVIPTRFIDRRVCSVPVEQKFNLNYSEVGQRLARKAEETLKTVEVSKEKQKQFVQSTFLNGNTNVTNAKNGPSLLQAALAYNKKNLADQQPQKPKSSGSGGGSASDDWQNSVDDWKKRRREKKNLPEPRTSQSFDFNEDEDSGHNARNNERKRINRFENSPHYLSPPPTSKEHSDTTEQQSADDNKPVQTLEPLSVNTKTSSPENKNSPLPKTFETTATSSAGEKTNDDSNLNESAINDEDNDSMICTDFNYKFTEKLVEIERPFDHNSRGFGFLLNSGLQNKASASLKKLQDENIDNVLSQNFAQIVMVENGSLASQAGLIEGDLVTLINEVSTENLTNEQLRKVMRQRLQLNSIQMNLLTLKKLGKKIQSDSTKEKSVAKTEPNAHEVDSSQLETNVDKTTKLLSPLNTTTTSTPSNVQNKLFNLKSTATSSNPTHPHVDLVTPKPYKKSTSTATLQTNPAPANATTATLPNQLIKSHSPIRIVAPASPPVKVQVLENDDTDHDNDDDQDDDLLDSLKLPPPVPLNAPPPLPKEKNNQEPKTDPKKEDDIKKALYKNIKTVENWKAEQELLLKRKYEEGQKKIEISLKLDLEKVKEEENQRREQERLKLEREKLRLQELEIKQKEEDLIKTANELKVTSQLLNKQNSKEEAASNNQSESVRKEDLTALIEKLYTEEIDEKDILTDYSPDTNSSENCTETSKANSSRQLASPCKSPAIVMTKTSPIVLAALNLTEEEDFELSDIHKHNIIKQVHDSMDNLKTQLMNKGMENYAEDVSNINGKLNESAKKQQEADALKREQEAIRIEKEKLEKEKERLRQEAEQLRIERELILLATQAKNASKNVAATSGTTSSSTSSTSSTNDQVDLDFSGIAEQNTHIEQYKFLNQFTGSTKTIPIVFPRTDKYPNSANNNSHNSNVYQKAQQNPQSWLIEEAERQRVSKHKTHQNIEMQQRHRRSVPNLLNETNASIYQPASDANVNNNYQSGNYTNQSVSSTAMTRIYHQNQPKGIINPLGQGGRHSSSQGRYQRSPTRQNYSQSSLSPNPYLAKPPTSNTRHHMSSSQNDLKNITKHQQTQQQKLNQLYSQQQKPENYSQPPKLSTSTSNLSTNTKTGSNNKNCPVISLNQKCSCCSQTLGQGSAMFIEKLGLAFHLKCFRCSVCNVALGNGKEGTDVRVSVTNRLHCNNCFSNDLGKIYFNFNFIHCDFASQSLNDADFKTKKSCHFSDDIDKERLKEEVVVERRKKKPEIYYKMYKMALNRNEYEKNRRNSCAYDDSSSYLIIPNYLTSTTTKRHSSSYRSSVNGYNL